MNQALAITGMTLEEQQRGDIHATLVLSYSEALNGTTRTLTLPGGRRVIVPIPAGIHDGQEIRLADQGQTLPDSAGALILTIVVAPAGYLSDPSSFPAATDDQTEFIAPPPPPPPASGSPDYPSIASETPFTHYPAQAPGAEHSSPSPQAFGQPSQYSPSRPHRGLSVGVTILLIVLTVLLIGGGALIYSTTTLRPAQNSPQASATAQATTRNTAHAATAQTQATATAVAQANAPGTATASALQHMYTQATSGTPALNDPLNHQDNYNWDESANCAFIGGAYHASSSESDNFFTCTPNAQAPDFGDFTFQVQMVILKGDYGGVLFRANSTGTDYYTFTITQPGQFSLDVYQNDGYLKTVSSGSSPVIKTGLNQSNLMTIIARGGNFYLYMNGQFVANARNTNYSSGQIGLLAGDTTHPTEVAFSNLKVWLA